MTIREATIDDLPKVAPCAEEFYASSAALAGEFNIDHFCASWKAYIESGFGVIFLILDGEEILGTLGALRHSDSNSGRATVQETFWYTKKNSRGLGGLLYRQLLKWSSGCFLRMGFLVDSMPERMREFYEKQGFKMVEIGYVKEVT